MQYYIPEAQPHPQGSAYAQKNKDQKPLKLDPYQCHHIGYFYSYLAMGEGMQRNCGGMVGVLNGGAHLKDS